ncbi:zinc-binding dehydrogenase [Nonomuraea sp. MTCD27]|uniref:zinc-dependent alcohol dehydrogenase n=1 Tax=Nonomuraea sp. MTCD27 TaxID=1676747 RepID=UPI0035C24BD2
MKTQARYVKPGRIEIGTGQTDPPAPGEVRIEVAYTGLCGTDLHVYHGHMDHRVRAPAVIGHEMSGTIAAVGAGVSGWADGDHVTVMPLAWDGTCAACLAGHQHVCQNLEFIGIDSPGALQSSWNVRAEHVLRLPSSLGLRHAALVEPVAVAVHDVRRGEVRPGDRVVVLGGGPIGVLIAHVARQAGAEVAVFEVDAGRRTLADRCGFRTADPLAVDQIAWVEAWTAHAGADVVFEVSGSTAAVAAAPALTKVRGRLVVVAIHPEPRPVDLHRVFWRELTIVGARVYTRDDFASAIALLDSGVIPADELITKVVPLPDAGTAFAELAAGGAMKILIDCQAGRPS